MESGHLPSAPINPPKTERRGKLGHNKHTGKEFSTLPLPDTDTGPANGDYQQNE